MKERKSISTKNMPPRLPLVAFAVAFLFLDRFNAPGYVWGIIGTLAVIILIGCLVAWANTEEIDIFKDKNEQK